MAKVLVLLVIALVGTAAGQYPSNRYLPSAGGLGGSSGFTRALGGQHGHQGQQFKQQGGSYRQQVGHQAGPGFGGQRQATQYGPPAGYGHGAAGYGTDNTNSEPVNYEYSYEVSAPEYGVEFGHEETREGEEARGKYHVLLPDGRRQTVDYVADQGGYRPTISYEESGPYGRGGSPYANGQGAGSSQRNANGYAGLSSHNGGGY